MRNLLTAALIAVTLTATAQINTISRDEYKEWKYFASDELYANTSSLDGYVGWAAVEMEAEGYESILYVYMCSLTEGSVSRILTFMDINCPECMVIKQMTYMPDGYNLHDAGDLYLAAKLDRGYAIWKGLADMEGNKAEIIYSVKNGDNLLFVRFLK